MTQTKSRKLAFDEFLEQYPDGQGIYELVDGEIVEMRATREHDLLAEFIADRFKEESKRLNLNYLVTGRVLLAVLTKDGEERGRNPDVSVVDRTLWKSNRKAYSALTEPIQLAVEIVSSNWQDDYIDKLDEYERLGIPEYWIVDYLGIGGIEFLGKPKQPTVFVHNLDETGKYQRTVFRDSEVIISKAFPELQLTVREILEEGI
ncbi:Uma2 family endonuclease [Pseudanabaena sp. PCC 6802]|uniref:Uma2 family endonuclease n=1 Tax=Pseudanabaena sp. PCC 6802 TaxID=118173 RepID=UPI000349AC10|nr:Uma2 family endonuclease [Pseudanabaena sp. PCC 6802]